MKSALKNRGDSLLSKHLAGFFCAGLLCLTGCNQPLVTVSEVLNHKRCNGLSQGVKIVELADLAKIRGVQMLPQPNTDLESAEASNSSIDATDEVVLLAISNGSQPTPGYAFEFLNATAANAEIELHFAWQTPAADAILAQVITSPCSVIQLTPETGPEGMPAEISAVSAWLDGELLGRVIVAENN